MKKLLIALIFSIGTANATEQVDLDLLAISVVTAEMCRASLIITDNNDEADDLRNSTILLESNIRSLSFEQQKSVVLKINDYRETVFSFRSIDDDTLVQACKKYSKDINKLYRD